MNKQLIIEKTRNLTDKQSLLDLLNEVKTNLLGHNVVPFSMHKMMMLSNPNIGVHRYRQFSIPKKTGGFREIYAPNGNLKWMQICLNEIFKAIYSPSPYATGFVKGKSVVDNARFHTNQNYIFNIDLANFFPSIAQARVRKRLQLPPFNFNYEIANIIAGLCAIRSLRTTNNGSFEKCYNLPQGAPTSPILTNAICDKLDHRLAGLARRFNLHYSRYADDITFSSMHNVYQSESEFRKELERIIANQGFTINSKKTRLNHRTQHQEVTGITVSNKINVSRKYIKDIRAILHIWERYGINAALSAFYPRYRVEKGYLMKGEPNIENIILGKLCYLKMIKGEKDPQYIKLSSQFTKLTSEKKQILKERSWEYLNTEYISDFENHYGVHIRYAKSQTGKPYAFFNLKGERIMVSVSQNISLKQIPKDAQISLCLLTDFKIKFNPNFHISPPKKGIAVDDSVFERIELDCRRLEDLGQRFFYLIHRPLKAETPRKIIYKDPIAEKLKKIIVDIAQQNPQLGITDHLGIIQEQRPKDLLTQLIESEFDLSILP